ncbi:UPF0280 family protein [Microbulbifer sp. S227A]|uniref:UPF0280 family protein n=1 Tax=Microbulbifer sp. S227A TaxID=3415131 RepID=UPI003C7B7F92
MQAPQISVLPDGRRWHFHHGPIDLIVDAVGPGRKVALRRAARRFDTVLTELASELGILRRPAGGTDVAQGRIARAMQDAVSVHLPGFVTPMAAVAGAVADDMLGALCAGGPLRRAYVNNGGDVAVYLAPGECLTSVIATASAPRLTLTSDSPVRGVATSGWRGRSHSLGIADSVTVLAETAVQADVAATLIANAVDLPGHPAIRRARACDIAPDSDLGARRVTVDVGGLSSEEMQRALSAGGRFASDCLARRQIIAAYLQLGPYERLLGATKYLSQPERDGVHA